MARDFELSSSQYLQYDGAVVSSLPFSIAAWINSESRASAAAIVSIGTNGGVARYTLSLNTDGTIVGGATNSGGTSGNSSSVGATSNGTWAHAGAIFTSATSRQAVLNGTIATANTTSITVSGVNRTNIGARFSTTIGAYFDGIIAECGIWDVALAQQEWSALADGVSPLLVSPSNLIAYWPLMGRISPEIDLMGGAPMTLVAAPAQGAHPPIRYPGRVQAWKYGAAAPGGSTIVRQMLQQGLYAGYGMAA